MRTSLLVVAGGMLFGVGYLLGTTGALAPARAVAQEEEKPAAAGPMDLSEDSRTKIKAASDALKAAMESMMLEQRYNPATKGLNAFGVLSGQCSARDDLEAGRGVDPETYAALYAGLAVDELQEKIGFNSRQQLTFNGKPVVLYSKNRIRTIYATRAAITGEELPGLPMGATPAPTEKKPDADADTEAKTDEEKSP